jgi:predicted ATP-dependent endonuclease of OLD family
MKLARAEIQGFRCLRNVSMPFNDLTILLGSNSAGKSSALRALKFFFEGDRLDVEDIFGRAPDRPVVVQLTFDHLTRLDREVFGPYARSERMVLARSWENGWTESRITGRALRFEGFDSIKEAQGKDKTQAYKALRREATELNFPEATNVSDVEQAMLAWEMDNPDRCVLGTQDATRFFGYSSVGQSLISQRFKFVFVPGLRDAADEATERKGSILERLLFAIAEQRARANSELAVLEQEARGRYENLVAQSHGPTLRGLADRLEGVMRRYVPDASISLAPVGGVLKFEPPRIALSGGEAQDMTDLSRQGHGFQRTFIIAALEYLAETAAGEAEADEKPTLFFAIEEPELYQHPPRARHFFATLRRLALGSHHVQVCYATHSPYFVSPSDFSSIRIFRRLADGDNDDPPETSVTASDELAVAVALPENKRDEVGRYLARTMRDAFCEAFFANIAVIAEGPTDIAVLTEVMRLLGSDPAALGVVFVPVVKSAQPIAVAVLRSLGIPTYVVFDSDAHHDGENRSKAARENRALLALFEDGDEDFPTNRADEHWACFSEELECYLEQESSFRQLCRTVCDEFNWSKPKSAEVYAEAINRAGVEKIPSLLRDMAERILAVAPQRLGDPMTDSENLQGALFE